MSFEDEDRSHTSRRRPSGDPRAAPVSLYEVQKRLSEIDDKLIELAEELSFATGRLTDAETAWKGHKAKVNLLIAASGEKTNEDFREAESFESFDPEGRSGKDLYYEWLNWKSQVETLQTAISTTQSRGNNLRWQGDAIKAAGG